jgi:hypothetical protein
VATTKQDWCLLTATRLSIDPDIDPSWATLRRKKHVATAPLALESVVVQVQPHGQMGSRTDRRLRFALGIHLDSGEAADPTFPSSA